MTQSDCYKIGYIIKPHGLKGQVTIALEPDAPADFESINSLFIETGEKLLPYFIENISVKGNRAFLKLEEVDTPEQAKQISRSGIFLPLETRPKSGRGEFYDDEVIGFEVVDSQVGSIGKVAEVVRTAGNRILSVVQDEREVLIPLNAPFIDSVNKGKRRISITLPEGYLEI